MVPPILGCLLRRCLPLKYVHKIELLNRKSLWGYQTLESVSSTFLKITLQKPKLVAVARVALEKGILWDVACDQENVSLDREKHMLKQIMDRFNDALINQDNSDTKPVA